MLELYQRVVLSRNFPDHNLKKGNVLTLIDYVPHLSGGEDESILEVFNAVGESINVIVVPMSAVHPFKKDEIFAIRSLY
ncbi:MAG TPA: DUF4926 domain-containing protein [Cyanobacteria bacterium UBA8803]|nr:DUF4926 domain-containing protein [Cyanobacteria bacterium UBA9273]HBL61278.1 DUF4926 domain-containing protein [Cyanobacteria bacterium UBA8803]